MRKWYVGALVLTAAVYFTGCGAPQDDRAADAARSAEQGLASFQVRSADPAQRLLGAPEASAAPTPIRGAVTSAPAAMSAGRECCGAGDVNGDGIVSAGDAQMAFLIALGAMAPSSTERCAADWNNDAAITAGDAQSIFMACLGVPGLSHSLPCGCPCAQNNECAGNVCQDGTCCGSEDNCTSDADCDLPGACPPDAVLGCACATTPRGQRCVPSCVTADDCPQPPDQTLTCSPEGLCVPDGGGTPPDDGMDTEDTISDEAQSMTIAFDGLAFVTGTFCAQTFYPPGKVADFFGFQYLRDNDPSGMGHNTEFTTLTADPVLVLLHDAQLQVLADLGTAEAVLNDDYGYGRFPLALAFRRLNDGDTPAGHPTLSQEAVEAYSAALFSIDGEMSSLRAEAYATVLNSLDAAQRAVLDSMRGQGALDWPQPSAEELAAVLAAYPGQMMRTYAGEMLAWYLGDSAADTYFCPERQGTYFGSFFMKDIKAMHNPDYTIDANMTAEMGDAFLAELDPVQRAEIEGLVAAQRPDLLAIVAKREQISLTLRTLLQAGGSVDEATVLNLARQYGELDGAISYAYATGFATVGRSLSGDQAATLMALRKTATAEEGGTPDYDDLCGNGYLYSAPLQSPPQVMNTDFLFGVCAGVGSGCSTDWDCCSFSCASNGCAAPFTFTSSVFEDGGTLPVDYTCDGAGGMMSPSPPLAWSGAPVGTVELALTMTTLALDGTKYNWVLFHIPSGVTALAEGSDVGTPGVSTDGPELRYYPPCSSGPGAKTYTFTLYALSEVPTFDVPESQVDGPTLLGAIAPLTLASRQLDVTYTRP